MARKFKKIMKILHVVAVWGQNFGTGPALRAMFKINMAGRDCSGKTLALKQYYSRHGKSWLKRPGNYSYFSVGFSWCARLFENRFHFPFVQLEFWSWEFRFWTGELPENLWCKVLPRSNFDQWREFQKIPRNSSRGGGLRPEFRHGSCAARNVQN